jgi:hypothetical protein
VIPRKGRPGKARQATEHRRAFRRTIRWRTGCEGRISSLKRGYRWDRTRLDGTEGARTWTGHGILACNLVKIAVLPASQGPEPEITGNGLAAIRARGLSQVEVANDQPSQKDSERRSTSSLPVHSIDETVPTLYPATGGNRDLRRCFHRQHDGAGSSI